VIYLREEMSKIVSSEAFCSLEGRTHIEKLLEQGTQHSIANALNELIQNKITEYSSIGADKNAQESLMIGDLLQINFQPSASDGHIDPSNPKMEQDLVEKF